MATLHNARAAAWSGFVLACVLGGCHEGGWYAGGRDLGGASGATAPPCVNPAPDGGACARSQQILSCDVTNARDLGGVPLGASGSVACGQIFRGPPLFALSTRACDDVARLGIKTIIDLRTVDERLSRPDDPCVAATRVFATLPIPYTVSPTDYLADFDSKESMARIFQTLADPAAYPIYFHCTWGRDRTGVVAAAVLLALGASRDDIMAEYKLSAATVGAFPGSLEAVLNEIETRGGIQAALAASGVTGEQLAALRARVSAP
jgi:hypothetical protein